MRGMVIAGTKDAREILQVLQNMGLEMLATVTTPYGKSLIEDLDGISVHQGKLNGDEMAAMIHDKSIGFMIDASHPFAREASENAILACKETGIPYLRFERKDTELDGVEVIRVSSFEEAADQAAVMEGNIFLTIGSNHVKTFTDRVSDFTNRLYARILPDSRMVAKCEAAGLNAKNIIAMQGPFSEDLNAAMLKHCKAAVMVTKESGAAGGTGEKLQAAVKLGIPVILVERPEIAYGMKVSDMDAVAAFVKSVCIEQSSHMAKSSDDEGGNG